MKICNFKIKAVLIAAIFTLIITGTAWGTTLSFTPDNPTFVGDELQIVQIVVDDVEDLLGVSLIVEFDPAVVTPVDVTLGDLMGSASCSPFFQWTNSTDFTNTVEIDAAMLGCTVEGGGTLLNIIFSGTGAGTAVLSLPELNLRDSQNEDIDAYSLEGAVTYLPEIISYLAMDPESVLFVEGETCEVCLYAGDVPDFLGMSVNIGFNPSVLLPIGVSAGPALEEVDCSFFLDWVNSGNFYDSIEIDMALLGCSATIDGPLVCLTFEGVEFGESPLTWLEVDVRDSENELVMVNTSDGIVMYSSAVSVVSTNLGGLKAKYRN